MNASEHNWPRSIAIAGAWGYIGRKFLDVALARGLITHVLDPGPAPSDVDLARIDRVADESAFYALDADLFHLAVHPEARREDLLLARPVPPPMLNEKPMAAPEHPDRCREVVAAVDAARAVMLYDFPELYDPLTARVLDFLRGFRDLRIESIVVQRSKDREDPANPRNRKRMVPIQYQESVHCLAWALYVLASVRGDASSVLDEGVRLEGESDPYAPPNPEAYPHPVDGRVRFRAELGGVPVDGLTDFKRHAEWSKRRVLRGTGDGAPFEVDVSYLEGGKSLRFNGVDQPCDPKANSYAHVLTTAAEWINGVDRDRLMKGLYPNPRFTRLTYHLSAALWRACRDRRPLAFGSADALLGFDAAFGP